VAVINVKGMGNVEFPDSMSPEEIKAALDKQFGKAQQHVQQGFAQNVGQDIGQRAQAIQQTVQGLNPVQGGRLQVPLSPIEAAVQGAGQVAGGLMDVSGEAAKSGLSALYGTLPPNIRQTLEHVNWAQQPGIKQGLQALQAGGQVYQSFKNQFPQIAKDIESMVNISTLAYPTKGRVNAPETPLGALAGKIENRAAAQVAAKKRAFVNDLVMPQQTKKVMEEQVGRTTEKGLLRKKVVDLSPQELAIAEEVNKIPSVTHSRSIGYNYNQVANYNTDLAKKLESELGRRRTIMLQTNVKNDIKNNLNTLIDQNPLISSDRTLKNVTNGVARNAERIMAKYPSTPVGILKARQEFDRWALDIKNSTFEGKQNDAFKLSVKASRDAMNNAINQAAPYADVATSLDRQSKLFNALDNMKSKAATEGPNALVRTIKRVGDISAWRGHVVQLLGAAAGVGAIGATQLFNAPVRNVAALGLLGWGAGKAIMSPSGKRLVAGMIRLTDRAIRTTDKPSLVRQMRADRAILVDMLKNATIQKDNKGQ